jgi:glycerophosphoryl diester phosphodiesterase
MRSFSNSDQGNPRKPLIIAHRGSSFSEPENTIAAFRRAVEDGADGIEMDVRLAADGVAVVIHDSDLKRTAGIPGRVSRLSSEQLSMIDVGATFRKNGSNGKQPNPNHRLPTLVEVLQELSDFPGLLYIELKCKERDAERLAVSVSRSLSTQKLAAEVVIKSFRLSALTHFRHYCPDVRTAALFAPKILALLRKEKHLVRIAVELGVSEISLHRSLVTRKLMKKASRRGLPVAVWTADHPRWVKRAIRLGVKAIITNDPARLLKRRNELAG